MPAKVSFIQKLREQGFDRSGHVPGAKEWWVRCSSCEAAVVNGVACHETGCPNQVTARNEYENDDGNRIDANT